MSAKNSPRFTAPDARSIATFSPKRIDSRDHSSSAMPSSSSPCPDVNDAFRLRVFRPKGVTGAVTDSLPYDPFSKLKSGSARLTDKLFSKGAAMLLDAFLAPHLHKIESRQPARRFRFSGVLGRAP